MECHSDTFCRAAPNPGRAATQRHAVSDDVADSFFQRLDVARRRLLFEEDEAALARAPGGARHRGDCQTRHHTDEGATDDGVFGRQDQIYCRNLILEILEPEIGPAADAGERLVPLPRRQMVLCRRYHD